MLTIELAGIPIGIENRYPIQERFKGYSSEREPFFTVSVSDEDLEAERKLQKAVSDRTLEYVCVYRKIAEFLPEYEAFVFHGAAVAKDAEAYLFTAPSGTGKSTHANLWTTSFPDAWIINGDKPIIRKLDGRFYACGTPWKGKEGLGTHENVPIRGLCLLHQSKENRIYPVRGRELAAFIMRQVYLPKDSARLVKFLDLLDEFCCVTPTYSLYCNMDQSAAELSFRTMSAAPEEEQS